MIIEGVASESRVITGTEPDVDGADIGLTLIRVVGAGVLISNGAIGEFPDNGVAECAGGVLFEPERMAAADGLPFAKCCADF